MNIISKKNPKLRGASKVELNAAGSVIEEITTHIMTLESMSGGTSNYSCRKGNDGRFCTITVECQAICSWF